MGLQSVTHTPQVRIQRGQDRMQLLGKIKSRENGNCPAAGSNWSSTATAFFRWPGARQRTTSVSGLKRPSCCHLVQRSTGPSAQTPYNFIVTLYLHLKIND